jgi:type IV pilus assembly protein PilA
MLRLRSRRRARRASGFTLVELLTVVAIVGVLATIATMLVMKHFRASKGIEATAVLQAIRAGQEARRAETGSYLNVSQQNVWYPATPSGTKKTAWATTAPADNTDAARWQQLGVTRTDGTQFGFKTWAGNAGAVTGFDLALSKAPVFPTSDDIWYVMEAAGDIDSDGSLWLMYTTSFDSELYTENEGD